MKFFCEYVVAEILPCVRAMVARDLVTRHGVSQSEAATLLGITQPAISQYVRKLRGKKEITGNDAVNNEIRRISDGLRDGSADSKKLEEHVRKICNMLPKPSGLLLSEDHLSGEPDDQQRDTG